MFEIPQDWLPGRSDQGVAQGMLCHMARSGKFRRLAAWRALWRAIRAGRQAGGLTVGERFSALPRLVGNRARGRYPELGRLRLTGIILALLYLLSPIDVLPELFLSLLGLGDDALVALWLAGTFFDETQRYLLWERSRHER